jgi:hypothetical protein
MFHKYVWYNSLKKIKSDQVKTGEYEYPYQIYEVPIQSNFLNHQVMTSFFKHIIKGHNQNNDIDHYTRENVKAMKSGDGEEVIGKVRRRSGTIMI